MNAAIAAWDVCAWDRVTCDAACSESKDDITIGNGVFVGVGVITTGEVGSFVEFIDEFMEQDVDGCL